MIRVLLFLLSLASLEFNTAISTASIRASLAVYLQKTRMFNFKTIMSSKP